MIAHHTCHGGYNKLGGAGRFRSKTFALGGAVSRARDWLDWMLPEAWNLEHNRLHHYHLGEDDDPDLVERNLDFVRQWQGPRALKLMYVAVMATVWKWAYYAPNTYKQLKLHEYRSTHGGSAPAKLSDPNEALTVLGALFKPAGRGGLFSPFEFLSRVLGAPLLLRFVLPPAILLLSPFGNGSVLFRRALLHLALADGISNLHAFLTIVTNHAGDDLYRFGDGCAPHSPTFAVRQVVSSANYRTAGDLNDFMHGWLNYQIEHHVWPNLSMLSYQKAQPELRAICERHGVPYVQQNVFERLRQTLRIMIGDASMRRWPEAASKAASFEQ